MFRVKFSLISSLRRPGGLIGMIALVAIVESFIGLHSMRFSDVDEWAYRWTSRKASRGVKDCQILLFGDSLIKLSTIPKIIEERTGKSVFNLALSGSQAPATYFLLRRVLDSGARPEAVVVDFNPPLLRVGPRHNLTRWPVLLSSVESAELAWWDRDPELFGSIMAGRVFSSVRGKTLIRTSMMDAIWGRPEINRRDVWLCLRNWKANKGAQLMTGSASHGLTDAEITRLREGFYPEWKCHPVNVEGIDRFLSLAEKYHIRVFWILTPLIPALHDQLAKCGIDVQHERFLSHWQEKYPTLTVLDARKKISDLDAFWDPQHLSVAGASAFSLIVGDALRASLRRANAEIEMETERNRWVSLPSFRLGPNVPGIENIDQSRLVLEASPVVRR